MLTRDQPSFAVASVAVGVVRGLAERADFARFLVPAQHAVVRNVAPYQRAAVAEPDRPFIPASPLIQTFDRRHADTQRVKARIEYSDGGIGITALHLFSSPCLSRLSRVSNVFS